MKVKTLNGNLNIIGKNLRKYRKLQKNLSARDVSQIRLTWRYHVYLRYL